MAKPPRPANENTSKQHDEARKDFESGKSPKQSRDEQRIKHSPKDKPGRPGKK
jgi:hypothetical protein